RQSVVEPARLRADEFRNGGRESDYVVANFGLDLTDALDAKIRQLTYGFGSLLGDDAGFGQSFGSGNLHLQPRAKAGFFTPNAAHLRARVAWDQRASPEC